MTPRPGTDETANAEEDPGRPKVSPRSRTLGFVALSLAVCLVVTAVILSSRRQDAPGATAAPTPAATQSQPSKPTPTPAKTQTSRAAPVILDEEFDGDSLDTKVWNTCHWWNDDGCTISSNDEMEWYLPKQVSVSDGVLHLTAKEDSVRGSDGEDYPFRSGMVTTGSETDEDPAKVAFTYGKIEARVRLPAGRGLWPAMWLLPASLESRPEIDIMEVIGQQPQVNKMHLHPVDRDKDSYGKDYRLPGGESLADGWHTIGLDWSPGRAVWLVDGKAVWQVTGSEVPKEPMYLVFNLAVGGAYPGEPDSRTRFPAQFDIDYVRVTGYP